MALTRPRAHQLSDSDYKQSVRVAQSSNVTLSGGAPATVDGISLSAKDRVLVIAQSDASQNGIYIVSAVGSGSNGTWVRATDADDQGDMTSGLTVKVTAGTAHDDTTYKLTTDDPITLGSTNLVFELASAYAFGQVNAGGTTLTADQVNDLLTISAGTNVVVTGNAGTDTATISLSTAPTFTGNITGGNLITTGAINVTSTSLDDSILITTTEDSSTAGPVLTLKRNSSSPADGDYLGQINFKGENDADEEIVYSNITGKVLDASDGTEDGILEFAFKKGGSNNISARFRSDSLQLINGTTLTVNGLISTDSTITATSDIETTGGDLNLKARGETRFYDSDSSNYVALRAGSTVASNLTFNLPVSDGTSGQVIQTDGGGTLSFVTASGSGGSSGYTNSTITTFPTVGLSTKSLGTGADNSTEETPFEAGGQDAFNVPLGLVYDNMEPIGSYVSIDLGEDETHVGA